MRRRTLLTGVGLGLAALGGCLGRVGSADRQKLTTELRNERSRRVEGAFTVRDRDGTEVVSTPFVLSAPTAGGSDAAESTRRVTSGLVPGRTYEFRVRTDGGPEGSREWAVDPSASRVIRIGVDAVTFEQLTGSE